MRKENRIYCNKILIIMLMLIMAFWGALLAAQVSYGTSSKFALGNQIISKDGDGYTLNGNLKYSYYLNDGTKVSDTMYSTAGNHRYLTVGGKKGYCVEFGIKYPTMLKATNTDKSDRLKYLPKSRKDGIKFTALYGMQSDSKNVPKELENKCNRADWYWATQCVMWEFQTGLRSSSTSKLSDNHFYNTLKNRPGKYAYKWIINRIADHKKIWTFSSSDKSVKKSNTITLKWNQNNGRYEAKVADTNKILYPFTFNKKGIGVENVDYDYIFHCESAITKQTIVDLTKTAPVTTDKFMIWSNDDYGQTMCTSGYSDSVRAYTALVTEADGSLKLVKTSENNKVEGFKFEIFDVLGNNVMTAVTDKNGQLAGSLKPGDYTVREILNEEQKKLYEQPAEVKVNIKSGQESFVNFGNKLKKQRIVIVKKDKETEKVLGGAIIGIYDKSTDIILKKEITNEKGEVIFDLEGGKEYYFKELESPLGYILNNESFEIDAKCEKPLCFILYNNPQKQRIEITKTDIETGEALKGAEYEILDNNEKQIYKGETDKDGKWLINDVPLGKYYYHELLAPNGYMTDDKKYEFEIKDHGEIKKITVGDMKVAMEKPENNKIRNIQNNKTKKVLEKAPDTGDRRMQEIAGALSLLSITAVLILLLVRRRN